MGERSSGRPATHDGLAGWEAVLDRERLEWELVRVAAADLERLEEGERDVVRAEMQRLEVRAELLAAGVSEGAGKMGERAARRECRRKCLARRTPRSRRA